MSIQMKLWDEILKYREDHYRKTGVVPTSISLTKAEVDELRKDVFWKFALCKSDPNEVLSIMGMDIYCAEDAKARRMQILSK